LPLGISAHLCMGLQKNWAKAWRWNEL